MSDNTELKRLAEAATAGPWSMCGEADGSQGFEIIQDIWNEHGTHTGMDVVVYEWSYESDPLGVIRRPDADFIAAANPSAVAALIAENERLQQREQDLSASVKYWFNACGGKQFEAGVKHADEAASKYIDEHWRRQRDQLRAENAGLRTGYEAYERVNAELKAENEVLKKRIDDMSPFKGAPLTGPDLKCLACGEYHYGLQGLPCPNMRITASAALGQGEQS